MHPTTSALRDAAIGHPDTTEGVACEGTAVEKRTVKTGGKAFLFLGPADAMLKLADSLAEAEGLALADPDHYRVGAHGWVTVRFDPDADPPIERLVRWIGESRRTVATPKRRR